MTKGEKKDLLYEINDIRKLNIEQNFLIIKYLINVFLGSISHFGFKSIVTKEVLNLFNKYKKISNRENNIYDFLLKNYKLINISECFELIDNLDELNSKTIEYFYSAIDDILDACYTKEEIRARHNKRNFKTLDETDEYEFETRILLINYKDIKDYLSYPDNFWNYISSRITIVDSHVDEIEYKVFNEYENKILKNMKLIMPNVINVNTANIVLYELKCAYCLYNFLGNSIDEDIIYSKISKQDNKFKEYVMRKKV